MSEITQILNDLGKGQSESTSRLLELVYDELKQMASLKLRNESPGSSLQVTALVHEAYLRLAGSDERNEIVWQNRSHFFGAAAEAMRRILVDAARRRNAQKRGGEFERIDIDDIQIESPTNDNDVLAINDVLDRLVQVDADAAQLVKLRFYAGMRMTEIAEVLNISVRSAQNVWVYARAWLRNEIAQDE